MANEIGDLTFDAMNGSPSPPGTVAEALPRAVGEDYNRWRLHGYQGRDTTITVSVYVDDENLAYERRLAIIEQQGSELDIVDAFGRTHLNCQILMSTAAYGPVFQGGADKYRVFGRYIVRQGKPD